MSDIYEGKYLKADLAVLVLLGLLSLGGAFVGVTVTNVRYVDAMEDCAEQVEQARSAVVQSDSLARVALAAIRAYDLSLTAELLERGVFDRVRITDD